MVTSRSASPPPTRRQRELAEETGLALRPTVDAPLTLTLIDGGDHRHWILGYRFEADPRQPLVPERDPVAWHSIGALPRPSVPDLAPLLAALTRSIAS